MPYPTAGPPHLKHLQHLSAAHWIPHPASARLHPSGFHLLPEPEAATPTGTVHGCCWQRWGRNQLSQTHPLGHPLLLLRTEKHHHAAEVRTVLPGRKGAVTFNSPSKHKQRGRAPKTTPYGSDAARGTPEAAPVCATQQGDQPLLRARGKLATSGGSQKMRLSKAYGRVSTTASAGSSRQHFGLHGHPLPPLLPHCTNALAHFQPTSSAFQHGDTRALITTPRPVTRQEEGHMNPCIRCL